MDRKTRRRIQIMDTGAKWMITLGGIAVIACMVVMIILMADVAWPLFKQASATKEHQAAFVAETVHYSFDDYFERAYFLDESGLLTVTSIPENEVVFQRELRSNARIMSAHANPDHVITCVWDDGTVTLESIIFKTEYDDQGQRSTRSNHETVRSFGDMGTGEAIAMVQDQSSVVVQETENGLAVHQVSMTEDLFGDIEETSSVEDIGLPGLIAFDVSHDRSQLVTAQTNGQLTLWALDPDEGVAVSGSAQLSGAIHDLTFVYGDASIAVADDHGLGIWMPLNGELLEIRSLKGHTSAFQKLIPSRRDKSVFALSSSGSVSQIHATSEREVLEIRAPFPLSSFMVNQQGKGIMAVTQGNQYWFWRLDNPHPDVSFKTLWLPVWYEGYPEPVFTWQSSAATDDFEPKTSLMPLLFGSLKGTFYSMIFALPIALLGAIYTSYLMDPKWKRWVKPAVELMAAIPTVVIGFLAALWLAPRLEDRVPAVFMSLLLVPIVVIVGMTLIQKWGKVRLGREFYWVMPLVALGVLLSLGIGEWFQQWMFDGDFRLWYFETFSKGVDQRNCLVIAFALGFAVIPIIFTISEDALSNVPAHITAASLALGATPWQTLRRVVLPIASPGIFAAAMIGFGRAVGETMIVLMATGNTPIMEWSIFNGMRTLSANIAVEIPEAPVDGSLYRILFLTALLLFVITFIVNTAAEFVRHKLSKKYKQA
ncbi:MAG: ABC transporter permease subunit [Acidobacteria bacterium]|nr:ABC transporter permease subunit [Acidobacteriota bacterium]